MLWYDGYNRPVVQQNRFDFSINQLQEIKSDLYDHLNNCNFSSSEIDEIFRSLETVKWNLDEYFRSHSYNMIFNRNNRYKVLEYLLEYAPIRDLFVTGCTLAEWDAFKNPDDSNTWKEKDNDYCILDENSICRLFFCNDEKDVWEYFADGYGNYREMVEYYYEKEYHDGDDSVLHFLMYLINHYDQLVYFYTRKRYQSVPRYNEVIELLKEYYNMYSDSFFSQDNISIAKEVWETGIQELRVEFIKSKEGLKILKQIL